MDFQLSMPFICLITLGVVIWASVYLYFRNAYNFWKKKGIKFLKPVAPFGNYKDVILGTQSIADFMKEKYFECQDEPYFGVYEITKPNLIVKDPELIKQITIKDFQYFQNRGIATYEEIDPLGVHLISISTPRWHPLRTKLSSVFTSMKLKMMFPLIAECAESFKEALEEPSENGDPVNISDFMLRFFTDIVGTCAFGLQFNAIKGEHSEFRMMVKKVTTPTFTDAMKRLVLTVCPSLLKVLRIKVTPGGATNFFVRTVKEVIEHRLKNDVIRNDFIDLLMQLKKEGSMTITDVQDEREHIKVEFTDTLLTAQAYIFIKAGSETSALTLSYCLYELAMNQDIQTKLRRAVQIALKGSDGKCTYEALQKMNYMDKVIDETLRKYPAASFFIRECTKEYTIPGTSHKIDAGQIIQIPIYGLHHDPKYFNDPEVFNPENFSAEAKGSRPKCAYIPFGDGPRNCIGMRFSFLGMKIGLCNLITNFKFSTCKNTLIPMKLDPRGFILSPMTPIWLKVEKLK